MLKLKVKTSFRIFLVLLNKAKKKNVLFVTAERLFRNDHENVLVSFERLRNIPRPKMQSSTISIMSNFARKRFHIDFKILF